MQQEKATKEAIKAETSRAKVHPQNLSLLELHTWQIIAQQAPTCYSEPNCCLHPTPEAACGRAQPSSPVMAFSLEPSRFGRAQAEAAKNCPSRNDSNRLSEERQMDIWFGCGEKKMILAFNLLYQSGIIKPGEIKNGLFPRELSYTISQEGFCL